MNHTTIARLFVMLLVCGFTGPLRGNEGFTISISGNEGTVGEKVLSSNGEQSGEQSFTSDSNGTFYTDEESYSGGMSLEMNVNEGTTGFGFFGGIMNFPDYTAIGGKRLVKGDEIWVRLRIKFPSDFEFNDPGRNKFLRLRTFSGEGASKVSEGYNNIYLNPPPGVEAWPPTNGPYQFIFGADGAHQWYSAGEYDEGAEFLALGEWHTVEYYLRLDDQKGSEGGNSMVRFWLNGDLLGETNDRNTLVSDTSYLESFYLFTFFSNAGSPQTQKLWVDDLIVTSETPSDLDAQGNPFVGLASIPGLLGDFDNDEDVDGADFLQWQRDPTVGSLSDWEGNFGAVQSLLATQAVPEPTAAALAILATISLLARRHRPRPLTPLFRTVQLVLC